MRKLDPVRHDEKRREILDAAKRCFTRDGFRGASISDICAEAEISPGHLYHYFSGKEDIVAAMAEMGLEAATERFGRIMDDGSGAISVLTAELERAKTRHDRSGQALLLDMLAEAGRNTALGRILREHSQSMRALLADFLRKGQERGEIDRGLDPESAAATLISVIDAARILTIRDPKLDAKKSLELLKTMVRRFLTPPPQ